MTRRSHKLRVPSPFHVGDNSHSTLSHAVRACALRRESKPRTAPSSCKTYESILGNSHGQNHMPTPILKSCPWPIDISGINSYANGRSELQIALDLGNIIEVPADDDIVCLMVLDTGEYEIKI